MARNASDLPDDPGIVVTNPEEDCSPDAFRTFIDDLLAGPDPELDSIGAPRRSASYVLTLRRDRRRH